MASIYSIADVPLAPNTQHFGWSKARIITNSSANSPTLLKQAPGPHALALFASPNDLQLRSQHGEVLHRLPTASLAGPQSVDAAMPTLCRWHPTQPIVAIALSNGTRPPHASHTHDSKCTQGMCACGTPHSRLLHTRSPLRTPHACSAWSGILTAMPSSLLMPTYGFMQKPTALVHQHTVVVNKRQCTGQDCMVVGGSKHRPPAACAHPHSTSDCQATHRRNHT